MKYYDPNFKCIVWVEFNGFYINISELSINKYGNKSKDVTYVKSYIKNLIIVNNLTQLIYGYQD